MSTDLIALLLIDDDDIDRELVRRLLGVEYRLHEAATGQAGLAVLTGTPDPAQLVLLDYWLPDANGLDLLRAAVTREIPVIVLTGEERPDLIVEAMQLGAQDYLIKGRLNRDNLQRAILNALEKADLKRSMAKQQRQLAAQAETLAEQNWQIRTLASALTLAEQRERKRIAQIVHDDMQQLLYGIQMRLKLLETDLAEHVSRALLENLTESTRLLTAAMDTARSLAVDLSPPVLKGEGIDVALLWLAAHMERVHGLTVHLQTDESFDYMVESDDLYVLIFQNVRELLFNVVKHANVKEARVRLFAQGGRHLIAVEDEGAGFELGRVVQPRWQPNQGYGLYSIRERLALFGGALKVDSHPGDGARITITLPEQPTQAIPAH